MVIKGITYMRQPVSIAPLVMFRIVFGLLMFCSVARFIYMGWVTSMYVAPKMFFPFFGFEWLRPLPEAGMYAVFFVMLVSTLCIAFGAFYRVASLLFFVLFTYIELLDKTNYLNHYYFISLVSFILVFLPANRCFSVDNLIFRRNAVGSVPRAFILVLQLQLFIVYFFAGLSKLNADWLFEAQPLRTWLPAFSHFPVIGRYMEDLWMAYAFSWFGCIYDLTIGFLLFNRRTALTGFVFVIIFHAATALFFNIGMFPYIMICATTIFFPERMHRRALAFLGRTFAAKRPPLVGGNARLPVSRVFVSVFAVFFLFQLLLPFRFLLYSGKLFWTEQGYRFSWRVMLMEKAGVAFYKVSDRKDGRTTVIDNSDYLTFMQEKMMATQPDMMVDYARFLKREFLKKGYNDPVVTVQSFVTVNGSGSLEFVDPSVDLGVEENHLLADKKWIRSY